MKNLFDGFFAKLKANKKLEITLYVALAAIAVIVYIIASTGEKTVKPETTITNTDVTTTQAEVEARLAAVLSQIRGAGEVTVMITYDSGTRIVPAMSTSTQTSKSDDSTSESESGQPATINQDGDEVPIVLTEISPTVRGVIVIAKGACDINVRLNLAHAVQTVLGVSADCIEVFEMGG